MKLKLDSKKGIIFTILAVLISAIVVTSFFAYKNLPLDQGVDNTKIRIQSINKYNQQAGSYINAVSRNAGEKTLNFTIDQMISHNQFLGNYTKEFISCLNTGTMTAPWAGTPIACPSDANLVKRVSDFEDFSNNALNINSDITINSIKLEEYSPWRLQVIVNYTIKITDSYASWNETVISRSFINIEGYRDPTYYIMSSGSPQYSLRYNMTVNSSYISGWVEQTSTLHMLTVNQLYFQWEEAPSFLSRLNNQTTPSASYGIVSIVSPDHINESMGTRSSLDYEFWKSKTINPGEYRRYDFWNDGVEAIEYGIEAPYYGLNGTVVPVTLTVFTNMDDPAYLDTLP
ncbi:MAG: hypothetical protein ACP5N3_02600 [Candidatus Nanoarchaeia archaeon]